jgi:hypothetical protein
MRKPFAVAMLVVTACGADASGGATRPATDVATKPVEQVARTAAEPATPTYVDASPFDFRRVLLDPTLVGTVHACDIGYISSAGTGVVEDFVRVHCANVRASIGQELRVSAPAEAAAAFVAGRQIEVRIDAPDEHGALAATFVRATGELRPPEADDSPRSRCLCTSERDRVLAEAEANKPPESWNFDLYDHDREKYWGTRQICVVSSVSELARSSPDAREYGAGRVFDPEKLPYAASVYCQKGGRVYVGSDFPTGLLSIARGDAIEIELGWSSKPYPTGRWIRTRYRADD